MLIKIWDEQTGCFKEKEIPDNWKIKAFSKIKDNDVIDCPICGRRMFGVDSFPSKHALQNGGELAVCNKCHEQEALCGCRLHSCKYGYSVGLRQHGDKVFWVAQSMDLSGCVGQGDTIEAAVVELVENEKVWLETAEEENIPVPRHSVLPL